MPGMQRDMADAHGRTNGNIGDRADSPNGVEPAETLDVVVVGAGFAGVYLLHKLRKAGFNTKIIEAGAGLGGIWWWNAYPGARVDSQYPIYALSLPEVYEDWNWSSHYPDHVELRAYFEHIDKKLQIKKDTVFNNKVVRATFDESEDMWFIECDTGRTFKARHFIACLGFAAKRHFPDWEGLDSFQGEIHHSSFWPHEGVDVRGKRCGVVGTGATGVQITQEWAREIGEEGNLKMFQRTPNLACPMNQVFLTEEEQKKDKETYPELFNQRWQNYNGFLYQYRPEMMFEASEMDRNELFDTLWKMVGRPLEPHLIEPLSDMEIRRAASDF
ncbi:hypothetical protein LTR37_016783 [Vermiconidia calcicola]|uniref:Uncharacterized protein n=1 Tax=Vermiconidia calcicola TaxID=1690605 RepID=A0ACC3MLV2_9PEZI|nr:hypothetical protein LTR37_016783 [Vermiconidia calcicola]